MESTPEIFGRLRKIEIFADFAENTAENEQILQEICSKMVSADFQAGDIIINEGDVGDSLYVLAEGSVQVMRNTLEKDRFAVINLSAEQNVFFGEMALISRDKRSASVVALTHCKTFIISGVDYLALCENRPVFGYKSLYRIGKRLIASLHKANNDVITLYQALVNEVEHFEK
ncbi:MAG: cyclic nucleotide-binding domain-containing protein [Spirochaetales bacterium]